MKLLAIGGGCAVYSIGGKIRAEKITQGARDVLDWYYHNVPANENQEKIKTQEQKMTKYLNTDWELLRDKLRGCETVADYLAKNMAGLTIQDLQERLGNLAEMIQETRNYFLDRVEQ